MLSAVLIRSRCRRGEASAEALPGPIAGCRCSCRQRPGLSLTGAAGVGAAGGGGWRGGGARRLGRSGGRSGGPGLRRPPAGEEPRPQPEAQLLPGPEAPPLLPAPPPSKRARTSALATEASRDLQTRRRERQDRSGARHSSLPWLRVLDSFAGP